MKNNKKQQYNNTRYFLVKSIIDFLLSFFLIILLSPVLVLLIIVQFIFNGLPIFYFGLRTGYKNKKFRIIKFRSMVISAEKIGGDTTAKNDPRITKFGRFLRKTKLDEVPQLFNILKGDMSFVGPRPELPYYTNQYKSEEKIILLVKPGITDFSSLKFINLDEDVGSFDSDNQYENKILHEKNKLRIRYAREVSLKIDVQIFIVTIVKVVMKIFNIKRVK